jgi:aspartate beta-hydroxylase
MRVRERYSELIDTLLDEDDGDGARRCAELAVELGIWRDPLQRPAHYVSSLAPRPIHDPAEFWFTGYLEENYDRIRAELDAITDPDAHGFLPVDERELYDGRWDQVVFYEMGHRFDEACARFPVTAGVIDAIPESAGAGPGVIMLSWLYPGTRIKPHCGGSNARLRVHLGLAVPPGPRIRVGDQELGWEEGRCIVFDDSFEHEVWHDGDQPRVVLLMDISHPDLDADARGWLLSTRESFTDRIGSYLTKQGIRRAELVDDDEVRLFADDRSTSLLIRHLREVGASAVELRDGTVRFGGTE